MDATILGIMQKGPKRAIARVEVEKDGQKIIVPVRLKEGMNDDTFKSEAISIAEKRLSAIKPTIEGELLDITPPSTPEEIPEAIQTVKDYFIAKIGEKIPLK